MFKTTFIGSFALGLTLLLQPAFAGPGPGENTPGAERAFPQARTKSAQAQSGSDLSTESKNITAQLQTAITSTEDLTSAHARTIRSAFSDAFDFIQKVVNQTELSDSTKVALISPVADTIAAAYGDLADPFTNVETPRDEQGFMQAIGEWARTLTAFTGRQLKFWFVSWFQKESETPAETYRRIGIGKAVFRDLHNSLQQIVSEQGAKSTQTAQLNELQTKLIQVYAHVLQKGLASEPYKYRKLTKGLIWTVAAITGFYALMPQSVQHIIPILPPVDFFPPFTFMERTFGSVLVARALWTVYGVLGVVAPRLMTGYGLGGAINKTRLEFEAIQNRYGIKLDKFVCKSLLKGRRSDSDLSSESDTDTNPDGPPAPWPRSTRNRSASKPDSDRDGPPAPWPRR